MSPTTGYAAAIDSNALIMSYLTEAVWGTTPTIQIYSGADVATAAISNSTTSCTLNAAGANFNSTNLIPVGALIRLSGNITGTARVAAVPSNTSLTLVDCSWSAGVVSAGAGVISFAFQSIRLDGEGFSDSKTRNRPNEINSSGQASQPVTTKVESTGSLNFSVSAGLASNLLLASSLAGVWTTPMYYTGADITISASSGSTCTLTATAATFTTAGPYQLVPGQFIKLYSATDAAANAAAAALDPNYTPTNSGTARVKAVSSATVILLDCCTFTPADKNLAAGSIIKGCMLRNGTTFQSFTFEKQMTSALFLRYSGAFPTGGSLDVGVGSMLTGTMSFLNKKQVSDTAILTNAVYTAAPNATVINSINGIGTVWRGVDTGATPGVPAAISAIVQKLGVKWNKESAGLQFGIGSSAAAGIRPGKLTVSGSMSSYFKDFTLFQQYQNESGGPISFFAMDGDEALATTKGYVITICNATIMNPKIVCGGAGQDVVADFEIEGNPDISSTQIFGGKTIQIDYFG